MPGITAIFFDIGGVLGTNGWGHVSRRRATDHFKLSWEGFEARHAVYSEALDTGKISLQEYVEKVALVDAKGVSADEFKTFMRNESKPDRATIQLASSLAAKKQLYLATLNNESPELNDYRIELFRLADCFSAFFSSGYLGVRKPDRKIYEIALSVSHKSAQNSVFIDDREVNLTVPRSLGMQAIKFISAEQTKIALGELGVDV